MVNKSCGDWWITAVSSGNERLRAEQLVSTGDWLRCFLPLLFVALALTIVAISVRYHMGHITANGHLSVWSTAAATTHILCYL